MIEIYNISISVLVQFPQYVKSIHDYYTYLRIHSTTLRTRDLKHWYDLQQCKM